MKRFLAAFGLACLIISVASSVRAAEPIISRITIRGTDIFDLDTKAYLKKFPYTWINLLHIQTKQQVIERELLFKVGQPVDDFLLEETERNLRALSFIQSARITKFPQRDGTVAVVVYVSDAWTTEPQINAGGQNRVDTVEFGLREKNVFGYGKRLDFLYATSPDNVERTYRYLDPHLLGSRWQLNTEYINASKIKERNVGLTLPYFSADTPFSITTAHNHTETILGAFQNNVKVSEFEQTREGEQIGGSIKVGNGRKVVNHAGLRWRKDTAHYAPTDKTTQALPESQDTQTVFVDLETIRNKFVKLDRVDKMTRVEDFNLGPTIFVSPGFAPRALNGGRNTDQFSATYDSSWLFNKSNLLSTRYTYSGREVFNKSTNVRNSMTIRYYYRDFPIQTIAFHTRAEWGHQLDPDNQIILGGDSSMRAYKTDQFVGNRSWVMNLEDRIFFVEEALNLISIGGVAFYDVGGAWSQGQNLSTSDLHNSLGLGLRFGLTKSSSEAIIRFDVSYRMEKVPTDDNRVVYSFGTSQAF